MEAMTIHFKATEPFAVKVFMGGVNVLSGKQAASNESKVYDWLEIDNNRVRYLDGFPVSEKHGRQFVATTNSK
jgi:hypothetical protein